MPQPSPRNEAPHWRATGLSGQVRRITIKTKQLRRFYKDQAPKMIIEMRPFLKWSASTLELLSHQSSKEQSSGWGVGFHKPTQLRRKNQNSRAKTQVVIRRFISSSWSPRGSRPDVEDLSLQADQQSSTYHTLLATWRNDICRVPKISKFFFFPWTSIY
jgi:hypothetical protein